MILIIGYIEIYDSLILAILILHIGKAQATVLHTIICLDGNLTIKLYLSWSAVLSISNREFYGITFFQLAGSKLRARRKMFIMSKTQSS